MKKITLALALILSIAGVANAQVEVSQVLQVPTSTTSFTPTLTQITIGNGTITGNYVQIGKVVVWKALLTFGSTTSIGALPRIAVPVAALNNNNTAVIHVYAVDISATTSYQLDGVDSAGTNDIIIVVYGAASAQSGNTPITTTLPFTWATGDTIQIGGVYFAQ